MKRVIAPVLILLFLLTGCDPSPGTSVGNLAPTVEGTKWITYSGKAPEPEGKVKLVEFWYGQCPHCCNAAPKLQALHKQYKDKGLVVLAPSLDPKDQVNAFRTQFGVTYPMLPNAHELAETYGVTGYPMMFIVGKDGVIKWKGHFEDATFSKTLTDALDEP